MNESREIAQDIEQNKVNLDTAKTLGRIEANQETMLQSQRAIYKLLEVHDTRITKTEMVLGNIQIKIALASAVVGALFAAAVDWIWNKLMTRI